MAATGGVSVIVRARDEVENVARCLDAIRDQRGVGEVEIVYVDGGSRDDSIGVARAHGVATVHAPPGFGTALNLGAERCTQDVLGALSAHAFPRHPDWLARIHQTLKDATVACASGDDYGPDGERLTAAVRQDAKLARRRPEWGYSNGAGAFQAGLWRQRPFREDLPGCEDKEWALHWLGEG